MNKQQQGKVILGVAGSDSHVVGNKLIEKLLIANGFEVINLGACTPIEEFATTFSLHPDALCIAIGSLNGHAIGDTIGLDLLKKRYKVDCPVVIGGNLSVGSEKCESTKDSLYKNGIDYILSSPDDLLSFLGDIDTDGEYQEISNSN